MHVPLLVDDFLRRAAQLYPAKTAIIDGQHRFTYGEFQARVNRFAHALRRCGIGQGDRVCILSPNSHFFSGKLLRHGTHWRGAGAVELPLGA